MPSVTETEAALLAQIEADLAELTDHVNRWISDRFLTSQSPAALNLEDVTGLVSWLQQWHTRFDTYSGQSASLAASGSQAVADRLAQIRIEIDNSIASFTQMAASLEAPH